MKFSEMNMLNEDYVYTLKITIYKTLLHNHSNPPLGVSPKWPFVAESPDSFFSFFKTLWREALPDTEMETETTLGFLYNNRAAESIAVIVTLVIMEANLE